MLFNGKIVDTPDDSIKEHKNTQMADQKEGEAALTSNSGLDIILKDKNSMLDSPLTSNADYTLALIFLWIPICKYMIVC